MRSPDRPELRGSGLRHRISATEVGVWWSRVGAAASARRRLDWLRPGERDRLTRFASELAADRFVLGSALARTAVWSVTGIAPASVALDRTCGRCGRQHGAPRVGVGGLSLSITHAGELVGVALCVDADVGLDVEPTPHDAAGPHPELLPDLRRALHRCEASELEALPAHARTVATLRTWTRKEAVLKATRLGMTVPLERLRVSVVGPPRVVEWAERPGEVRRISLTDLSPAAHHVAAVACIARAASQTPPGTLVVTQRDGAELLGAWA